MSHTAAQTEWNEIKTNESLVKEKMEQYLAKQNSSTAGDPEVPEVAPVKKKRGRKKKTADVDEEECTERVTRKRKKKAPSPDVENPIAVEDEQAEEPSADADDEIADAEPAVGKKKPEKIRTAAEILAKKTRAPAQEKVAKEIHEINERIIQLVQVKNMGMATADQQKQLKKLLVEQKKKTNDLKRLKAEQASKKRARDIKKVRNARATKTDVNRVEHVA